MSFTNDTTFKIKGDNKYLYEYTGQFPFRLCKFGIYADNYNLYISKIWSLNPMLQHLDFKTLKNIAYVLSNKT